MQIQSQSLLQPNASARGPFKVSPQDLDDVVKQIIERFSPHKIILFGSYAYGQPHEASDVDLLVILDSKDKEAQEAVRICQGISYHFPLDLIVRTPETIQWRVSLGDSFLTEILKNGKILYERSDRRVALES